MKKKRIYNQTSLFGPLYAYLVVISPPDAVKRDIANIKHELNAIAEIGKRNLNSIAHITLTDKLTDESDFAATVANLLHGQQPFKVRLKSWEAFDHGHSVTLIIHLEEPAPVINLASLLKSASKTPHIAIAKRLPHETAAALGAYMQQLDYTAEWICKEVTVLRKLMSEKHLGWKDSFTIPLAAHE